MLLLMATAAMLAQSPPRSPPVTQVVVRGVASSRGQVNIAICTRETFMRRCAISRNVPARRGEVSALFARVPAGQYAVTAFHDEDGDGRIGRNAMGIPTEGYGFSRNAMGRQGPPSFADAAVPISASGGRVVINLRY